VLFYWLPLSQTASVGIRAQFSFHGTSHKKKGQPHASLHDSYEHADSVHEKPEATPERHEEDS
jgi:hypothetical protein